MSTLLDTLPWFRRWRSGATTAQETTPGGDKATPWQVVAEGLHEGQAVIIKGRLEAHEIPTVIQREAVGSLFGLTTGPLGWMKLLVPEPLAERALAILAETFEDDMTESRPESDD